MRFATVRRAARRRCYLTCPQLHRQDNGWRAEFLTHIGDVFTATRQRLLTGSGLGLSIVRRMLALRGMTVSVWQRRGRWIYSRAVVRW